ARIPGRAAPAIAWLAAGLALLVGVRRVGEVWAPDREQPMHRDEWILAQRIRSAVGPGDRLIALREYTMHQGGTAPSPVIYHYPGLRGGTLTAADSSLAHVEELIGRGATHLAVTSMSKDAAVAPLIRELKGRYAVVYEDE